MPRIQQHYKPPQSMRRTIIATLLLLSTIPSFFAQDAADQAFSSSLSSALKSQDKAALYSIASFDNMDDTWIGMAKASFDSLLQTFSAGQDIVVTVSPIDSATLKPIKYKDTSLFHNLPIVSQAQVKSPNTEQLKNRTTTFYLGKKDGKLYISCLCPQTQK
jgi:hypothetical protein